MSITEFLKEKMGEENYKRSQEFYKKNGFSILWGYDPDKDVFLEKINIKALNFFLRETPYDWKDQF